MFMAFLKSKTMRVGELKIMVKLQLGMSSIRTKCQVDCCSIFNWFKCISYVEVGD